VQHSQRQLDWPLWLPVSRITHYWMTIFNLYTQVFTLGWYVDVYINKLIKCTIVETVFTLNITWTSILVKLLNTKIMVSNDEVFTLNILWTLYLDLANNVTNKLVPHYIKYLH